MDRQSGMALGFGRRADDLLGAVLDSRRRRHGLSLLGSVGGDLGLTVRRLSIANATGPVPERHVVLASGPTYASGFTELDRYVPRLRTRRVEYLPTLEEGLEPIEWEAFDREREDERDDDRDWNKIGGSPRYLQGGPPDPQALRFLFQFTASQVGHEMGDAAECYGFIDEERRGYFLIESH